MSAFTGSKRAARFWVAAAAVAAAVAVTAPTHAHAVATGVASALREGEVVEPPRGFTALCARRPEICPDRRLSKDLGLLRRNIAAMYGLGALRPSAVTLTKHRYNQLVTINRAVNASIRPVSDRGPDLWSVTSVGGDCEEYVLAKMNILASLGWPRSAMRITVVRDSQGYHAILVVETDRGSFALDNMRNDVLTTAATGYQFIVAQSLMRPGAWVRVTH